MLATVGLSIANYATRDVPGSLDVILYLVTLFRVAFLAIQGPTLPGAETAGAITYPLYLLHDEIAEAAGYNSAAKLLL